MKKIWISAVIVAGMVLGWVGYSARANQVDQAQAISLRAKMNGFQEVTPKLTDGRGLFTARINGDSMSFELTYSGLTGNPNVAHLHFGQRGVTCPRPGGKIRACFLRDCGTPHKPSVRLFFPYAPKWKDFPYVAGAAQWFPALEGFVKREPT